MMDKTFEMIVDSFQDSKCDPNKTIYEFLNDVFEPFKGMQDTPDNRDALKYSFMKNLKSQFLQYEILMDDKDEKLIIATIIGKYFCFEYDKSNDNFFKKSPLAMTFQQLKDEINKFEKLKTDSIIDCFNKMVEKYNLQDFVRKVEVSGRSPFIAILPFISNHKDLEEYHNRLVVGRLM